MIYVFINFFSFGIYKYSTVGHSTYDLLTLLLQKLDNQPVHFNQWSVDRGSGTVVVILLLHPNICFCFLLVGGT